MLINTLPRWAVRLQKSLQTSKDMPESRFLQVATIGMDGMPQNRTLVFRHMHAEAGVLSVISDVRTPKFDELVKENRAGLCWYFTRSREQYRFTCTTSILVQGESGVDLTSQWQGLSAQGRKQFLWGVPKSARKDEGALHARQKDESPPAHFCQIDFYVRSADYLNLKANPQYRELHTRTDRQWYSESVIP